MRVICGLILVLTFCATGFAAPAGEGNVEVLPLVSSVTREEITWRFEKPARVGKFLNGDCYVVGGVTVISIEPKPLFGEEVKGAPEVFKGSTEGHYAGSYARNGSTLNMPAVAHSKFTPRRGLSGFDSRMPMDAYDPSQFTKLPIAMKPGDSLVSTISFDRVDRGYAIKSLAILTCVAEVQPADAFRPSFCDTVHCPAYRARDLKRALLLKLPRPAGTAKVKLADYAEMLASPWIDTVGFGRAMPRKRFQFYGPNVAEVVGEATLLLNLDYPAEEKERLLVNLVQVGIDLHGLVRGGASWPAEGGGAAGRKWPIVFAGLMLDDPKMYDVSKHFPAAGFHEDEQTEFCPVTFNGKAYERGWTGAKVIWTGHYGFAAGKFRREGRALDDYGPVELFHPRDWVTAWPVGSESYRRGMTSAAWVAEALSARLMKAEKWWNHDAFFAYVDRWMTEDDGPIVKEMLENADARIAAAKTAEEKVKCEAAKAAIDKANRSATVTGRGEMGAVVKELWERYRDDLPGRAAGEKVSPARETWR